jgi:hypothetical protein
VRNRSKFGPLFVSCRWMLVCGALGSGNETSIGACDASPLADVVAIAWADIEVVVSFHDGRRAGQPRDTPLGAISDLTMLRHSPSR